MMLTIRRKRMLKLLLVLVPVLAAAGLLAGLIFNEPWQRQAVGSSLTATSLKILLVCLLLLVPVGLLVYRCDRRPHGGLRQLHRDEGGTAMVEMLLALPFMTMILLVLLQATILFQASMQAHYAGYGVTRAACAIINSNFGNMERSNLMFNDEDARTPPSLKWVRIRRAAVIALAPISGRLPSDRTYNDPELSGSQFQRLVTNAMTSAPAANADMASRPWIRHLAGQYAYADYFLSLQIRQPDHWNYGEPQRGNRCPRHNSRRTTWTQWGWNHENFCPNHPHTFDYPHYESLELTLGFPIPLQVPWANRILYLLSSENRDDSVMQMQLPGSGERMYYTRIFVTTEL